MKAYVKYLNGMPERFFNKNNKKFVFFSEYGGYRDDPKYSPMKFNFLIKHDFLCENVSNEYFPW